MIRFIFILSAIITLVHSARLRIIDGTLANVHEFPYQVSMQWNFNNGSRPRHFCSGSIINPNWILTAAHCSPELSSDGWIEVVAGVNNIANEESSVQRRNVTRFVQHPRYNPNTIANDIAVVLLSKSLKLNHNIKSLSLARNDTAIEQKVAKFAGWGSISKTSVDIFPDELRKVDLVLRSQKDCQPMRNPGVSQICAGGYRNASGCIADSGGPLTVVKSNGPVQIGVLSYGERPCQGKMPIVFSSVLYFSDWIRTAIEKQ
ncbi:brachyurin-like [Anopheles nili]|uniref:brachyurin-like n=1 Tax=Anopheles nili TaxID=185578 RepID=UPI00237B329D|nr:brachyurin-like [Anopheles nili]